MLNYKGVSICVDNTDDNVIVTSSSILECNDVRRQVCDNKIGNECTKENADLG